MAVESFRLNFKHLDLLPAVTPIPEEKISFVIVRQEPAVYWCWAAVTASIEIFYNQTSLIQMCELAHRVFGEEAINCCDFDAQGRPPDTCDKPHDLGKALSVLINRLEDLRERNASGIDIAPEEIVNQIEVLKRPVAVAKREGAGRHAFVIYDYYEDGEEINFVALRPDGGETNAFPFSKCVKEFHQVCFTK